MTGTTLTVAAILACLAPAPARAQATQVPPTAPPEVQSEAPQAPSASDGQGTLSDQLQGSNGVVAPTVPGVDPGFVQPAPDINSTMPVIPPGGTPGINPEAQPK